jgi:hypothetical protein
MKLEECRAVTSEEWLSRWSEEIPERDALWLAELNRIVIISEETD